MYNFLKIARAASWKLPNTERMDELDFAEACGLPPEGFRKGPVTEFGASAMVVSLYEKSWFHGIERLICRLGYSPSIFEEISYSNGREKLYAAADEIRSNVGWERFAPLLQDLGENRFPKKDNDFFRKLITDERSLIRQTLENVADFYGEAALGYVLFASGVSDLARSNAMRFWLCPKRRELDLKDEFLKERLGMTVRFLSWTYPGYYRLPDRLGFVFAMRKSCGPYATSFSEASLAAIGWKQDAEFYSSAIRSAVIECWIRRVYCWLFEAGVPETVFLRTVEDVAAKAYVSFGGNLPGICEHIRKNHFPEFATAKASSDVPASMLFRRLTDLLDAMKTRSPAEFEKFSNWLFWKNGYDIQGNPTVKSRENGITNQPATMAIKDKKEYSADFVVEKLAQKGFELKRLTPAKIAKDASFAETKEALEDDVSEGVFDYVSVAFSITSEDEGTPDRTYLVVNDDDAYSDIKAVIDDGTSGKVCGVFFTEKAALRKIVEKYDLVDVTDFELSFSVGEKVVRVGSGGEAAEITSVTAIRYDKYKKALVYNIASGREVLESELRTYSKPAKK